MSIQDMIGKTPVSITGDEGDDCMDFTFSDGSILRFYHEQDCCESVDIEQITGERNDLIGSPILVADEREQEGPPEDAECLDCSDTWTFYTFRGIGGTLDVRWHGSSNGYYSESVDTAWITQ